MIKALVEHCADEHFDRALPWKDTLSNISTLLYYHIEQVNEDKPKNKKTVIKPFKSKYPNIYGFVSDVMVKEYYYKETAIESITLNIVQDLKSEIKKNSQDKKNNDKIDIALFLAKHLEYPTQISPHLEVIDIYKDWMKCWTEDFIDVVKDDLGIQLK